MESAEQGYQQTKVGIIPSEWEVVSFKTIFERVTRKNTTNNTNVLTISAQHGLINQEEFFNKSVSSKDLSGYILLHNGEFAYNKSYSKGYPMGAIKRLNRYEKGVLSSLYIYFKIIDGNSDYYEHYLESGLLNKEIYKIAQEGARNHGLLNMSVKEFFNDMLISKPPLKEQEKIAGILTNIKNAIEKQKSLISAKEEQIKGIFQKLLNNEISFEKHNSWTEIKLKDVLFEHGLKSDGKSQVHSVSVKKNIINQIEHLGRSYCADDTSNYNLVKPNDIVYTKSPTGDFPFGIIKQNLNDYNAIVSPLYGVFTPKNKYLGYILHMYFQSSTRTNNYLRPIVQKGAKNTMSITNKVFLSKSIYLPADKEEQQRIVEVLSLADKEISLLKIELNEMKKQQKGLRQKLLTGEVRVKI